MTRDHRECRDVAPRADAVRHGLRRRVSPRCRPGAALAGSLLLACASTQALDQSEQVPPAGASAPRRVLVYDFAFDPSHVALNRAIPARIARDVAGSNGADRDAIGRRLSNLVTDRVVGLLWDAQVPAEPADAETSLRGGDLVLTGEFVEIDEGDRLARTVVGLGLGASELRSHVQLYLVRDEEHADLLVAFQTVAKSSSMPSFTTAVAGVTGDSIEAGGRRTAGVIAEELLRFFTAQDWQIGEGAGA